MIVIPSEMVLLSCAYLTIDAWRIYMFLTAMPSLISFILIYQYPETPRYLMLTGRMIKSRNILERIYIVNNKNKTENYSVNRYLLFLIYYYNSNYALTYYFYLLSFIKYVFTKFIWKKTYHYFCLVIRLNFFFRLKYCAFFSQTTNGCRTYKKFKISFYAINVVI